MSHIDAAFEKLNTAEREPELARLIEALKGSKRSDEIRLKQEHASEELAKFGKHAVLPLINALREPEIEEYARWCIVNALASIGKPALAPLIQTLENQDEEDEIRWRSAQALGLMGDKHALEPLVKVIDARDPVVWVAAIEALVRLSRVRPVGVQVVAPLIRALGHEDSYKAEYAAHALQAIKEFSVEPLIEALKHEDKRIRVAAELGNIGDKRAVVPMLEILNDKAEDSKMREVAASNLGRFKDKRAVVPLINALTDKSNSVRLRMEAAWALGDLGDRRAVTPLIQALTDEVSDIRYGAVLALDKIGDERALPALKQLRDDKERLNYPASHIYVKDAVIEAIKSIGNRLQDKQV